MPWLDYSPVAVIQIGPVPLRLWGIFVALGIIVATFVAARRGERVGIPAERLWELSFWVSIAGFVGARVLYVLEHARDFLGDPLRIFAVWGGGMSIAGALIVGALTVWLFARRHKLSLQALARAGVPALLLGDAIGRLGGAASHMYVGIPTGFPLSYVLDGVQRHEVGVELALTSLIGFLVMVALERLRLPVSIPVLTLLWYSGERFLLDFLRAEDLRYAGLTLAQYFAIGGVVLGLILLSSLRGGPAFAGTTKQSPR